MKGTLSRQKENGPAVAGPQNVGKQGVGCNNEERVFFSE
jgi:hypothetical protein